MKIITSIFEENKCNSNLEDMDDSLYPSRFSAVIRLTSNYLQKAKHLITYQDVDIFKKYIEDLLFEENLSPTEIKNILGIEYSNFTAFIRSCLGIKTRTFKQAAVNYHIKQGTAITDKKERYWRDCQFKFDPFIHPNIVGFDLLSKHKFMRGWQNQTSESLHRDHMVSIAYGWLNQIDSRIISHPANCCITFSKDNTGKRCSCSITLNCLEQRIANWDNKSAILKFDEKLLLLKQPKSKEHKAKISEANKDLIMFTNGRKNIRQHKSLVAPPGFRRGMTRRKNLLLP